MTRLHHTGIFQNHYHVPIAILILKQNRKYIQEWNITINQLPVYSLQTIDKVSQNKSYNY